MVELTSGSLHGSAPKKPTGFGDLTKPTGYVPSFNSEKKKAAISKNNFLLNGTIYNPFGFVSKKLLFYKFN